MNDYIVIIQSYAGYKDFFEITYNNACKLFDKNFVFVSSRDVHDVPNFYQFYRSNTHDFDPKFKNHNTQTDIMYGLTIGSQLARKHNKNFVVFIAADYIPINDNILKLHEANPEAYFITENDQRYGTANNHGLHAGYFIYHNSLFCIEDPFILNKHWEECFGDYLRAHPGISLGDREPNIESIDSTERSNKTKYGCFEKMGFVHTHQLDWARTFKL